MAHKPNISFLIVKSEYLDFNYKYARESIKLK